MTMTIDELVAQAAQLDPLAQEELIQRLLTLRGKQGARSVLPPGTPGSVWLAEWEQVRIAPAVADEMERVIEGECERIDPHDWQ
jgi:hypothetical protein